MRSKSSVNLSALATYQPPKAPRPNGDLFHPEFFEPAERPIVFTSVSIEAVEFVLTLLSISVLNQQRFREEPIFHCIPRDGSFPACCLCSRGFQSVASVRFPFSF